MVDCIANTWKNARENLMSMLSKYVITCKTMRADLAMKVWEESEQYRKAEIERLNHMQRNIDQSTTDGRVRAFERLDRSETSLAHNCKLKINDKLQACHKSFMEDTSYQPSVLRKFVREVKSSPQEILNKMTQEIFHKHFDDDETLSAIAVAEKLSGCLENVNVLCVQLTNEFYNDKQRCYRDVSNDCIDCYSEFI